MQAELKQQWLEALRSGKYEQGQSNLCSISYRGGFEHCCLGVLAEVYGRKRSDLINHDHLDRIGLSRLLGEWGDHDLGFNANNPETHHTVQRKLAAMNDGGKSFAEIADWIEANIPADVA